MQPDLTTLLRDRGAALPRAELVRFGLVQLFCRSHRLEYIWVVLAAILNGVVTLFWAPWWGFALWFAQLAVVLGAAHIVYRRVAEATLTAESPEPLIRRLALARFASAVSWASIAVFCWPFEDEQGRLFLMMLLAVTIASRSNTSAALPRVLLLQMVPPVVMILTLVATAHTPMLWTLGVTLVALMTFVVRHGLGYSRELKAFLELQADMFEAKAAAEAAGAAKSGYLAMLSHEIRTPMTGILGLTRLLLDGGLTPRQRDHVRTINESGEVLLSLMDDVLDMTKLEVGRLQLDPVPFEPRALLDGVVRLMRGRAEEKGLTLVVEVDPAMPRRLVGDALRLRQVLTNLLANALKFTDAGGVRVRIGVEAVADGPEGTLRFGAMVSDTGIGIQEEARQRLFQAFAQADASVARRFGGSGLGLSISRGLVHAMGGELSFRSTPGKGSDFWFIVPMAVAADQSAREGEASQAAAPEQHSLSVLVVDDVAANRKVLTAFLQRSGHTVTEAAGGEAAVSAVAAGQFDLVLMDLRMPGLDGLEATRRIRALPDPVRAQVPVLATTAGLDAPDTIAARDAGLNGWLRKPIRPEDLAAALAGLGADAMRRPGRRTTLDEFDPAPLHGLALSLPAGELTELVRLSRDALDDAGNLIAAGIAARDRDLVFQGAHQMRGTAGNFGLCRLFDLAGAIHLALGPADGATDWTRVAALAAELPGASDSAGRCLEDFTGGADTGDGDGQRAAVA